MKILISLTNETRNPNFETNLNDKPINIAKAEATHGDSTLKVFVELRAPNYPGSKYMLIYDPQQDRLRGDLFSGGTAAELQDEMNSGKRAALRIESYNHGGIFPLSTDGVHLRGAENARVEAAVTKTCPFRLREGEMT